MSFLTQLESKSALQSRTAKLWINHLHQARLILLFLRAERTGDWKLHIYSVRKMIPLFYSAGHLAYAKSARLYVQQMDDLSEKMSTDQFEQFTTSGYFTIRRSEHFWGGNFTDQTIEQELMRLLKTSGGMTYGRGITDSSLMKWVHALPHTIPICDALEKFTGTHATTSDQHKDLRASNAARDS